MFEAYTLLGALAARTTTVKLGTLVTGVTYRNPAMLAKIVTTLDVISKGRAFLGIGAAWFDLEHEGLGVDFPPVKERFERLEEALQICRAMFRGERPTFDGQALPGQGRHQLPRRRSRPGGPPIMIGGQGEKKTLRLMAQHAEMANFTSGFDELPRKLEVLAGHCADVGRDMADDQQDRRWCRCSSAGPTRRPWPRSTARLAPAGPARGTTLDEAFKAQLGARFIVGRRRRGRRAVPAQFLDLGLDGLTVNMPADGHDPEAVVFAGEVVTKAVA